MNSQKCLIKDIILLGFNKENISDSMITLSPFINEIANLLTICNIINIYPLFPKNDNEQLYKVFFDFLSLIGIITNVVKYIQKTKKYNSGINKGLLLLLFAFFFPNMIMDNIVLNLSKHKWMRFFIGILVIYLFNIIIKIIMCRHINNIDNDIDIKRTIKPSINPTKEPDII